MKSKKILIIIIGVIVLIAAVLGGLYIYTDFLKTDQQLFYKYIEKIEPIDSKFIEKISIASKRKSNSNKSFNTDINFATISNQNGEKLQEFKVASTALSNVISNQYYRDFNISTSGQQLISFKYIKDNNTYGILINNILIKYLAIENSNLKDFFYKLGVTDTSNIVDSIPTNFEELLAYEQLDEETLLTLKETYINLICDNISKQNFYKIKNTDKTETIGISLTEQEVINLLNIVLEKIKFDDTLLNLMVNNSNANKEELQTKIQKIIDQMTQYTSSTEEGFIKIYLTKNSKNVLKLGLTTNYTNEFYNLGATTINEQEKNTSIELDFSESNKCKLSIKENEFELCDLTVDYSYNEEEILFNMELKGVSEGSTFSSKLQYQTKNYQTDNIIENCAVDFAESADNMKYQLNIINNISLKEDISIEKLTTENSVKLNDMTLQELTELFQALESRIIKMYYLNNATN